MSMVVVLIAVKHMANLPPMRLMIPILMSSGLAVSSIIPYYSYPFL